MAWELMAPRHPLTSALVLIDADWALYGVGRWIPKKCNNEGK